MICPHCREDTLVVHRHDVMLTSRCRRCGWVDTYRFEQRRDHHAPREITLPARATRRSRPRR
jgi:hypothetical protein